LTDHEAGVSIILHALINPETQIGHSVEDGQR
jgi:hypothetical protein